MGRVKLPGVKTSNGQGSDMIKTELAEPAFDAIKKEEPFDEDTVS